MLKLRSACWRSMFQAALSMHLRLVRSVRATSALIIVIQK
jgi:hypothetical protein